MSRLFYCLRLPLEFRKSETTAHDDDDDDGEEGEVEEPLTRHSWKKIQSSCWCACWLLPAAAMHEEEIKMNLGQK